MISICRLHPFAFQSSPAPGHFPKNHSNSTNKIAGSYCTICIFRRPLRRNILQFSRLPQRHRIVVDCDNKLLVVSYVNESIENSSRASGERRRVWASCRTCTWRTLRDGLGTKLAADSPGRTPILYASRTRCVAAMLSGLFLCVFIYLFMQRYHIVSLCRCKLLLHLAGSLIAAGINDSPRNDAEASLHLILGWPDARFQVHGRQYVIFLAHLPTSASATFFARFYFHSFALHTISGSLFVHCSQAFILRSRIVILSILLIIISQAIFKIPLALIRSRK